MEAGRELDALVAEKVMGFRLIYPEEQKQITGGSCVGEPTVKCYKEGNTQYFFTPPYYSTSIAEAWLVVEKVIQRGVEVQIHTDLCGTNVGIIHGQECLADITEKTAPYAISLATLKAVGYEG